MKQNLSNNTIESLSPVLGANKKQVLLLFDGTCVSCDFIVNLILKNDFKKQFLFAPIQSSWGQMILPSLGLSTEELTTLVLIQNNKTAYTYSSAVFLVFDLLGFPFKFFCFLSFLPVTFTDFIYSLYARNRYRFFGKLNTCRLLTSEEQKQFLKEPGK